MLFQLIALQKLYRLVACMHMQRTILVKGDGSKTAKPDYYMTGDTIDNVCGHVERSCCDQMSCNFVRLPAKLSVAGLQSLSFLSDELRKGVFSTG